MEIFPIKFHVGINKPEIIKIRDPTQLISKKNHHHGYSRMNKNVNSPYKDISEIRKESNTKLTSRFFFLFKETDNECKIKKQSFIYVVTRNNTVIS
ncbi:hypothetical protein CWI36_0037p0040 [Hamiltosporidium magnivora]|uniref:Uncharacterized protein n=1 Tax=Hamiltosporidium magnivora TaxID=148818 RepID=A0A4Q9LN27_9MICR|nr:hypothetical protein CWI36_0037p0040 [Hamiltosporidium magnivora]